MVHLQEGQQIGVVVGDEGASGIVAPGTAMKAGAAANDERKT